MSTVLDARTATDHFPGIGRYVINLARALSLLVARDELKLLHDPTALATRLPLPDLPRVACAASPFSLTQQWRVPAALRQAHATLYHSAYYLMPYRPGIPTVLTCYDLIPLVYPAYYTPAQRLIFRAAHHLALNTARVVLAISEATKTDLVRFFHVAPSKVIVTPLAADPHFQPATPDAIASARQKFGLPENYILYFGSNKPHKNLARLVEAYGKTQIPNPKSQMIIAGHWDARYPEAKQLAEARGWADKVKFIGPVAEADLPALYSGAALFVFPSQYEGFGLPVLEAMACGAPVACSNASSLPEVAGEAALTFDPLSTEAMGEALRRALADVELRADLRQRGLRQAAHFTWEQTAQATLAVYSPTVTHHSPLTTH